MYILQDAAQIKKMIQLKESLDQRMGCVIVGPSGCGKSSLWRVLKAAMIKCGQPVVAHVMNPKSMHRERLLGSMDIDTREWSDGVLTDAARKVCKYTYIYTYIYIYAYTYLYIYMYIYIHIGGKGTLRSVMLDYMRWRRRSRVD
jgi:energy-coupling factor transporter ATP-binding protein EcfA2